MIASVATVGLLNIPSEGSVSVIVKVTVEVLDEVFELTACADATLAIVDELVKVCEVV
jgi:hypothetical protein